MDSLLANYASSDEEEQHDSPPRMAAQPKSTAKSLFSSIPPPNTSSSSGLFSLPPPKSRLSKPPVIGNQNNDDEFEHSGGSSLFSVLPQPKTSLISSLPLPLTLPKGQDTGPSRPSPTVAPAKKIIKLRPPLLSSDGGDDEDDDDEEEERKRRKKLGAAQLSWAVMPSPKNSGSLGSSSLGSGSSRRSIIDVPGSKNPSTETAVKAVVDQGLVSPAVVDQGFVSSAVVDQGSVSSSGASENYAGYGSDYSNLAPGADGNYGDYASYGGDHGNYANHELYQGNQIEHYQSTQIEEPTVSLGGMGGSGGFQMPGKRGRNNVPVEMVEVSQDELMKNRPREDQSKMTGIAFGPSYAPVSAKEKPNKLHKRKHQIGTLYVDMKAKELELAERRAKGFLTKAQTQGKYGW